MAVEPGSQQSNEALQCESKFMAPPQQTAVQARRRVILVGIGGSSASGKSTLAAGLAQDVDSPLKVFSADHYLDLTRVRRVGSWETPAGIAWDELRAALRQTLTTLAQCECLPPSLIVGGFSRGRLDLVAHGHRGKLLGQGPVTVFVEGFLLFSDKELCGMLDLALWIETDCEICARRRWNREGQRGEFAAYLEAFRGDVWAKYEQYRGEQLANVPQVLRLNGALEPEALMAQASAACRKVLQPAKEVGERVQMETYPSEFVSGLKALADAVRMWARHQTAQHGEQADNSMVAVLALKDRLVKCSGLAGEICLQICDVALAAAAVTIAKADFRAASQPQPFEVSGELWWRTQDLFWASARLACAKFKADAPSIRQEQRVFDRQVRFVAGLRPVHPGSSLPSPSPRSFADQAERVIPATVVILSTCREGMRGKISRTPYSYRVEGRCTELMSETLEELGGVSWGEFLWAMRRFSASGRFRDHQVPVLSCSRSLDLNTPFSLENPRSRRRRALVIGINYVSEKGLELSGGHSDAFRMQRYLSSNLRFKDNEMRVLVDDGKHECPNRQSIEEGFRWLVAGANIGDSLFLLYSGHGSTYVDDVEADSPFFKSGPPGADEALCPSDFRTSGMIFDDEIFQLLIAPLCEGVLLTCVIDCCQSGTILELPYVFKAEQFATAPEGSKRTSDQVSEALTPNCDFDAGKMLQVIQTHPAMCVAASHWAEQLKTMNPNHHDEHLGAVLSDVATRGRTWMVRQ